MNTALAIRQFREDFAQVQTTRQDATGSFNNTNDGFQFSVRKHCRPSGFYESREYRVNLGQKTINVVHEHSDETSSTLQTYVVDIQQGEVRNYERQEWPS